MQPIKTGERFECRILESSLRGVEEKLKASMPENNLPTLECSRTMRAPKGKHVIFQMWPTQAKVLVCTLGALVGVADFSAPGDINIAIFYCLAIVLTIWTRSLVWLWSSTVVFILLTFIGFKLAPPAIHLDQSWIHWTNRGMTAGALTLVAISIHIRIRMYELLDRAIAEREQAQEGLRQSHDRLELIVEQRTSALRQLSSRLLQAQDEERRRIARELHDSVGQCLTALKINVDVLRRSEFIAGVDEVLGESSALLDQALSETRTISHLLHPPLLDEAGFVSAARWYIDGFAKRSGVEVNLEMPIEHVRFSNSVELGLFRVLQESLTNVHRHSESPAVDIRLKLDAERVILKIRDYGHGMPRQVLQRFQEAGTGVGVGLAGMHERISELGGRLEISIANPGTVVTVSMPFSRREDPLTSSAKVRQSGRNFPAA
jgi:signal transduction histidine kinase